MTDSGRRRLLVLAFDPLTATMPGPSIRAWNLAEQLSRDHEVVLASTSAVDRSHPDMRVTAVDAAELEPLVDWADAIIGPTSVVRRHDVVARADKPLCIDMYIPTHLENLEPLGDYGGDEHAAAVAHQVSVINDDLRRGDFLLCASERQRDFWLGSLAVLGRLNPVTYAGDPTLRRLIDVVPFGVAPEPPVRRGPGLRDALPLIGPRDPVLVWGGGVYNWFDPLSLVKAVDEVRTRLPDIRLVFLGMRNPNPDIPEMRMALDLRVLSDKLGLTGKHVFFREGWVPYDQRADYLLDADIGVSTHLAHVETHFSFRTRVLDYLWAGLPMVLTGGDAISQEIEDHGLGIVVPPGDPAAIASAIERLIASPPQRDVVRAYADRYRWDVVTQPLTDYCRDPWRANDRVRAHESEPVPTDATASRPARARRVARWVRRTLSGRT